MALIEISHLTKTYGGNDIPALEDVNISLESGQIVLHCLTPFIKLFFLNAYLLLFGPHLFLLVFI